MAEEKRGVRGVYFSDCGDVAFPDSFFEKYRGSAPPVFHDSELKGEPVENKDWFWHFSPLRLTYAEGKPIFDRDCGLRTFAGAVLSALHNVKQKYGLSGYRERWVQHDFPENRLKELEQLLS